MGRGLFVVFEGPDGAGKSTQARLLADHFRREWKRPTHLLREPGGTPLGERVREILLDPSSGDLGTPTELFLFMAARAHLTARKVAPAIERGEIVVCDRYLWSSVVYQGIVGGLGAAEVLRMGELAGVLPPYRTLIIDLPPRVAYRRLEGHDRMESRGREYQARVRRAFLWLARKFPRNAVVIDGRGAEDEVHRRVLEALPAVARPGRGA